MKKRLVRYAIVWSILEMMIGLCRPGFAFSDGPLTELKTSVDEAVVILRDPELKRPELKRIKKEQLVAIVNNRFDFEEMSRRTLARHWQGLGPEDQGLFVDLFARFLEGVYISKIDKYNNQDILYKRETVQGERADVQSTVLHNGVEIPIDYKMRTKGNKWLVYDVTIEGVSLVANYRSQFESELRKGTFADLVKKIEEKVANLEAAN